MKKGFTLIELLAVVIVLAIIMIIAIPTVNRTIENQKKDSFFIAAKSIVRHIEYEKWEDANFDFAFLNEIDVSGISSDNYDLEQSYVYVENEVFKINLVGKGKFEGLYACGVAKGSKVELIGEEICEGMISPDEPANGEGNVAFGTNGNSSMAKSASTTVTVSMVNLDNDSLKYQWTTSETTPLEASFSITFTNEATINTPAGVTGNYFLWILAKDTSNNTIIVNSNKFNLDNTGPVISLLGNSPISIYQGSSYIDAGATATDNTDGNVTSSIQTTNAVNVNTIGSYTVTYNVSDSLGNAATPVVRTVNVIQKDTHPILVQGMIPVYFDDVAMVWKKANTNNPSNQWYDYDSQKWGNAVTVTSATRATYQSAAVGTTVNIADVNAMFVWIPRYKYRIPSGAGAREVLVSFESKVTSKSTGDAVNTYLTHPAFTFAGVELSGIWASKFEITGTSTAPTIKPDAASLRSLTRKAAHDAVKTYMQANTTFGFSSDSDIHIIKSTEWGAATLLYHSVYGKYGISSYSAANKELYKNNSSSYYTGRSMGAPGGLGILTPTNEYNAAGYYTYDAKCATIHTSLPAPCNTGSTGQVLIDKTLAYGASTSGTIYGVFDLSGGGYDDIMAVYKPSPIGTGIADQSGFSTVQTNSQYDLLPSGQYYTQYLGTNLSTNSILGESINETFGWYSDGTGFVNAAGPWIYRGGSYASTSSSGAFYYGHDAGPASSSHAFHATLVSTS